VQIIGVQLTLQHVPNLAKFTSGARILAVALGGAFASSVLAHLLPLFFGARQAEFSWAYIEMGLTSNVQLITQIAFVTFVWLRMRTDLSASMKPIVLSALVAVCALPSIENYLALVLKVDSWSIVSVQGIIAIALLATAKIAFNAYNQQRLTSGSKKAQ
jgi:hypothetical protein